MSEEIPERTELPIQTFYAEHYVGVGAPGPKGAFHRITHRALERGTSGATFDRVLEVGANLGEHAPFVTHDFDSYLMTDFRVPTGEVAALRDPRFRYQQADVQQLPFADASFDRVVCTCVLHHTSHPALAVQELRRVTAPGGRISILVPCDPGWSYRTAWRLTSGRAMRKHGVRSPYLTHAEEHPQHFPALAAHLRAAFERDQVSVRWWPLPLPSWNLNLFTVWQVTKSGSGDGARQ